MTEPRVVAEGEWTVLVVDSDAIAVVQLLERLQHYVASRGRRLSRVVVARSQREAHALLSSSEAPDLILVELGLVDGWGHELLGPLRAQWREAVVVVHTGFDDDENLLRALAHGAEGYILKGTPDLEFARLLEDLEQGRPALSAVMSRRLLHCLRASGPRPKPPLTPKEFEVVQLLARGLTNSETAACLGISAHTVSSHVKNIYRKLQVSSRAEMTGLAQRSGWVADMTT